MKLNELIAVELKENKMKLVFTETFIFGYYGKKTVSEDEAKRNICSITTVVSGAAAPLLEMRFKEAYNLDVSKIIETYVDPAKRGDDMFHGNASKNTAFIDFEKWGDLLLLP